MATLDYETRLSYASAIESTETLAVVLDAILTTLYDTEWYAWDPTTIYLELKDDLEVDPSSETMDRISAILLLKTSDEFFEKVDAFCAVANTLASGLPSFSVFDPVTAEEAAWALTEAAFIRGSDGMVPFSDAVKTYIETSLAAEGLLGANIPVFVEALGETGAVVEDSVNAANVKQFVESQTEDMVYQFHELNMGGVAEKLIRNHG